MTSLSVFWMLDLVALGGLCYVWYIKSLIDLLHSNGFCWLSMSRFLYAWISGIFALGYLEAHLVTMTHQCFG